MVVSFTQSDTQYVSVPEGHDALVACAVLLPPSTFSDSDDQASVTVSPVDFEEILDSFAVRFGDEVFDVMMWELDLSLSQFIEENSNSQRTVSIRQIDVFQRSFVDMYTLEVVAEGVSPPRVHEESGVPPSTVAAVFPSSTTSCTSIMTVVGASPSSTQGMPVVCAARV